MNQQDEPLWASKDEFVEEDLVTARTVFSSLDEGLKARSVSESLAFKAGQKVGQKAAVRQRRADAPSQVAHLERLRSALSILRQENLHLRDEVDGLRSANFSGVYEVLDILMSEVDGLDYSDRQILYPLFETLVAMINRAAQNYDVVPTYDPMEDV